ncbi:MAG: hypothetical protein QM831_12205 [Kofleriaceae bacterium]
MRISVWIVALAVLIPNVRAKADPLACHKPGAPTKKLWLKVGSLDQIWPAHPTNSSDPEDWTFAQQKTFHNLETVDTAKEAFQLFADTEIGAFTQAQRNTIACRPTDSEFIQNCAFDCNGNTKADDDYGSACSRNVTARDRTDPICGLDESTNLRYAGLYSAPSGGFVPGAPFTSTQTGKIKNANLAANGSLRSDARYVFTEDITPTGVFLTLIEPYPDLDSTHTNTPSSPEVDHVIPAVDKYGCGCGTNSPQNAILISKNLNGSTQNNYVDDDRRQAILEVFTKNYNRSTTSRSTTSSETDMGDNEEMAGCTAAGSNKSSLAIVALAGFFARRKRLPTDLRR